MTRTSPIAAGASDEGAPGRRPVLRTHSWGIADQAVSSASNFLVGVLVARAGDPAAFGAFSLVYVFYVAAIGANQALAGEPMLVRYTTASHNEWRKRAAAATGTSVALGAIGGGLLIALPVLSDGRGTLSFFLVFGIFLPALLLQDAWRLCFFSRHAPAKAFLIDVTWTVVLCAGAVVVSLAGRVTPLQVAVLWCIGGTAGALCAVLMTKTPPAPRAARSWIVDNGDLSGRYFLEFLAVTGTYQLIMFPVGALSGLDAVAAVRGAQMLFGPIAILVLGLRAVYISRGVALLRTSVARLTATVVRFAAVVFVASLLWTGILLLVPSEFGVSLLGGNWMPARDVVVPLGLSMALSGVVFGFLVGLRALADARRSLKARLIFSLVVVGSVVAGASAADASGAAWGLAIGTALGCLSWVFFYIRAVRSYVLSADSPATPVDPRAASDGAYAADTIQ